VKAIAGETAIGGKLPITLPGLFPLGHGPHRAGHRQKVTVEDMAVALMILKVFREHFVAHAHVHRVTGGAGDAFGGALVGKWMQEVYHKPGDDMKFIDALEPKWTSAMYGISFTVGRRASALAQ